jgi:ribokinase
MITVVGSLNMDLVIEVPRFPAPGETMRGQNFRQACGGKGANQACAVARMGMPTAMIGAVGSDVFGSEMVANLDACGVNTAKIVRRLNGVSGTAIIVLDVTGENQIILAPGANSTLSAKNLERRAVEIGNSRALLVQLETPLEAVAAGLRIARTSNVLTILNPAPFAPLPDELFGLCDFIIPNEIEASLLTGVEVRDIGSAGLAAQKLREHSKANVLVTLGAQGVWLATKDFTGHVPAFAVTALDTVGAGDAFIGAFAARIVEGADVREAARFGCAAAAIAVTRRGAQASIPSRAEVEKFLASNAPVA